MLNFGASKPRVKGGPGPWGPLDLHLSHQPEWSPESSCQQLHSQSIDIFPLHRNGTSKSHGFSRNHKAGGIVICAVTGLFTKPWFNCYQQECSPETILPSTAEGSFSIPQELYQTKPGTALPAAL